VLPLLSPHILSFIISCQVHVLTSLTLAVPIQIVENGICTPNFIGEYMIVGLNLLMLWLLFVLGVRA